MKAPENLTRDLEKARDEKCIPVAREVITAMADHLLVSNPDDPHAHDALMLIILRRALETDMNITMEAQYLFQLILGGFSGFNTTIHGCEFAPVDDERYIAIGKKMLTILAEANVRLTNVTPEDTATDFADAKAKLQQLINDEKLTKLEVRYIMDNIFESVKMVNNDFSDSLARSTEKAESKIFGNESMSDLSLGQINKVLINDVHIDYTKPVVPEADAPIDGAALPPSGDGQVAPPAPPEDVIGVDPAKAGDDVSAVPEA